MSFLAPYLLFGTLAASIPVALHFFYRSRYRVVPWAAMKFLLTSVEQTSRRLRFQELLLLLVRVAVLVILAVALARPTTSVSHGSGQGDAVDAVLVIDTSFSMAARDGAAPVQEAQGDPYLLALQKLASRKRPGDKGGASHGDNSVTRLDRAKALALAVIDHLPPNSTVQVITTADGKGQLLGPQRSSQLDQGRHLIEELEVCHLATDLLPGVNEAAAALQRGTSPNKELYVFSDQQKMGWEKQATALADRLKEVSQKSVVHLVRCGTRVPRNVAIVRIVPPSAPRAGERADFTVVVRNSGRETVKNLTVALTVDGRTKDVSSKSLEELMPGQTRAVVLSGELRRAGRRIVTASIEPDDLDADNRFDQVIQVREQVGLLLVDGSPNEAEPRESAGFFLANALNPVPVEVVTPAQASAKLLADKDLCLLVNVALQPGTPDGAAPLAPEFLPSLAAFVRQGHGLMIFAGEHVQAKDYNHLLYFRHHLLPMKLTEVYDAPAGQPLQLDRQDKSMPVTSPYREFGEAEEYKVLDFVEVHRALGVEAPKTGAAGGALAESQVLLRYKDGRPAVVSKKREGEGEVLLFTTSANDDHWTDWPLQPAFVPVIQASLNYLLQGRPEMHNRTAGEPLRWYPPENEADKPHVLIGPDGQRTRLGYPKTEGGRAVVEAADISRAGVYRMLALGGREEEARDGAAESEADKEPAGVPFAVVPDMRESEDLDAFTEQQLKDRLGFKAVYLTAGDEAGVLSGGERLNREWTMGLLLGLLGLTLGEAVLAWVCGRAW